MNTRILTLTLVAVLVPGLAAAGTKHKPRGEDRYMSATAPHAYPRATPTPVKPDVNPERDPLSSSANGS